METTAVLVVPPSLSLPRKGGGNAVAPLFTPQALHSRSCPDMCACRSAFAGTTARKVIASHLRRFNGGANLNSPRPRRATLLFERLQHLGGRSRQSWLRLGMPLIGDHARLRGRRDARPTLGLCRREAGRRFGALDRRTRRLLRLLLLLGDLGRHTLGLGLLRRRSRTRIVAAAETGEIVRHRRRLIRSGRVVRPQ